MSKKKRLITILSALAVIFLFTLTASAAMQDKDVLLKAFNGRNGICLEWQKTPGANKYVLFRKVENGKYAKLKEFKATALKYTDSSVKEDQLYTYTVRAYNTNNVKTPDDSRSKSVLRLQTPSFDLHMEGGIPYKKNSSTFANIVTTINGVKGTKCNIFNVAISNNQNFTAGNTIHRKIQLKNKSGNIKEDIKQAETYYVKIQCVRGRGNKYYYGGWSEVKKFSPRFKTETITGGKTYPMNKNELRLITGICIREQGHGLVGIKACASQMCNNYEMHYSKEYGSLYAAVMTSGWYGNVGMNVAAAKQYNPSATELNAVEEVICKGKRTLPKNIDEYDCLSDIKTAVNNGKKFDPKNRSLYKKGVTVITNVYGSTYTFYCFPDGANGTTDVFGYTR